MDDKEFEKTSRDKETTDGKDTLQDKKANDKKDNQPSDREEREQDGEQEREQNQDQKRNFEDVKQHNQNKTLIAGIIILAVLAAAGICFGMYGLTWGHKLGERIKSYSTTANTENTADAEDETEDTVLDIVEITTANSEQLEYALRGIIDKYMVVYGSGNPRSIFTDGLESDEYKFLSAVRAYNYNYIHNDHGYFFYDSLNEYYQELFGANLEIIKRDYEAPCAAFQYEAVANDFVDVTPGCGGALLPMPTYAVTGYHEIDDGFEVDTAYALVLFDPEHNSKDHDGSLVYFDLKDGGRYDFYLGETEKEQAVSDNRDKLDQYRFTFKKDSTGNYVLREFKKL